MILIEFTQKIRGILVKIISGLKLVVFLAVSISLLSQSNIAFAQSSSCSKLTQTLRSLDRNRDYRTYKKNNETLQAATKDLKQQESKFVRGGCQAQLNAKQKLSGACRIVARKILKGRSNVEKLKNSVGTGQMVAEQRQQVLQQIASRGCNNQNNNSRSSASVQRNNQPTKTLFDILFGNNGNEIQADDDFEPNTNLSTVRTVCARSCDGYFWPISFSTTEEYLPDDARQCKREAKGADVELFYHRNPGERAEDMISISGKPYTSTPNAFRYRNEYVQSCSIKRNVNFGSMQLVAAKEGETSRIMISFNDIIFPLPLRDPRRKKEMIVAQAITIPLPIPRPLQEGEEAPEIRLSATPKDNEPLRSFTLNGKIIRIVGPDTPYAQLEEEGT